MLASHYAAYFNGYASVAEAKAVSTPGWSSMTRSAKPEPALSHAAANPPGTPVDMWTIGVALRAALPPGFQVSSEAGKR